MGVLEDEGQPSAKRPKLSTLESDSSAAFTDSGAPCAAVTSPETTDMAGKLYMNGGGCQEAERLGSKQQIDKVEFVRLITQALYSLGYDTTAQHLESESRISLQSKPVTEFRAGVLEGRWEHCLQLLTDMHVGGADLQNAKFLLFQQFFLELLEANDTSQALKVLRSSVAPLGIHTPRIHQLARWVICSSPDHLRQTAQWSGREGDSRYKLLLDLQGLLPPSYLIPERRLEDLVEQSLDCQKSKCVYHNSNTAASTLFTDHMCGRDSIPSVTVKVGEGGPLPLVEDCTWHHIIQFR